MEAGLELLTLVFILIVRVTLVRMWPVCLGLMELLPTRRLLGLPTRSLVKQL